MDFFEKFGIVTEITIGLSPDKKYQVQTPEGTNLFLRTFSIEKYKKKKREFEALKELKEEGMCVVTPVEIGIFKKEDGKKEGYYLTSWAKGEMLSRVCDQLNNIDRYKIGQKLGKELKIFHSTNVKVKSIRRTSIDIEETIKKMKALDIESSVITAVLDYFRKNYSMISKKRRPSIFIHYDLNLTNIIYDEKNIQFTFIDFDRCTMGDPLYNFISIFRSCMVRNDGFFLVGCINGYFGFEEKNYYDKKIVNDLWIMINIFACVNYFEQLINAKKSMELYKNTKKETYLSIKKNYSKIKRELKNILHETNYFQTNVPLFYVKALSEIQTGIDYIGFDYNDLIYGIDLPTIEEKIDGNLYLFKIKGSQANTAYAWYIYHNNVKKEVIWYSDNDTLEYIFEEPGEYRIQYFIRDKDNHNNKEIYWHDKKIKIEQNKFKIDSIDLIEKEKRFTISIKSNESAQYSLHVFRNNKKIKVLDYSSKSILEYHAHQPGDYKFKVFARNEKRRVATQETEYHLIDDSLNKKQFE